MRWFSDLYLGRSLKKSYKKRKYQIINKKMHPLVFLILFDMKFKNLELVPSTLFLQPYYPGFETIVIGMASSKLEGITIIGTIYMECCRERKDYQIEKFLFKESKVY